MRRSFVVILAPLAAIAGFVAPPASAEATPIGNLGDTLRVEFKGIVADVTVHDVIPTDPPPGYRATGSPRWINEGGPWKALVTVHTIQAPTPYAMAIAFAFDGITPYTPTRTHPRTPMHRTPCNTRFRTLRRGRRSTAPCTGRCTAPS